MKIFISITAVLGIAGIIFGYWGVYTEAGNRKYDEMAGIIPMVALWLGGAFVIIALSCLCYTYFKSS